MVTIDGKTRNLVRGVVRGLMMLGIPVIGLMGCGPREDTRTEDNRTEQQAVEASLPADLFLAEAPDGVVRVATLKQTAAEGDEAVIRVVVGGRKTPVVAGRAIWTSVDASFNNACTRGGHACPEPWDYCCAAPDELASHAVTIQVQDSAGRPLAVDLTDSEQIKPMAILVVRGTVAARPNPETLVMNAESIYVESTPHG